MTRASSDRFRERIQGDGATRLPDPVIRDCVVEVEQQASPCLASRRWCPHHGRGGGGGYVCGGRPSPMAIWPPPPRGRPRNRDSASAGLCRQLACELGPDGIRVAWVLSPGSPDAPGCGEQWRAPCALAWPARLPGRPCRSRHDVEPAAHPGRRRQRSGVSRLRLGQHNDRDRGQHHRGSGHRLIPTSVRTSAAAGPEASTNEAQCY